ncbi:calcium-translocating P-type ATPase [Atractiella rhizophila]|nr:calcium-translocating P-type ATPase [Atractiella rhizophila]
MTSLEAKGTTEEGGQSQGEVGVEKERSLSHPPLRPPQSQTSLSSTSRPPLPILVIPQSSLSVPPRLRQPQPQEEEESAEFASSPAELSPPASESKFLSPSPIPSLTLTESYGPPSPTASTLSEDSKSTVFHPTTSLALRGNEVEKKSHGRKLSVNTLGSVGETEEEDVERLEEGRKGEREGDGDRLDEKEQRRENTTSPSAFTISSSAPSSTSRLSRVPLIGRFFTPKDEDGIPLPATSGKGGSSSSSDENGEGDGEGKKKKKKEKEVPDKAELIADPSDEGMAPFSPSVKPSLLNALVDPKSFENLEALGRTDGLLASLGVVDGQGLDVAFEATLQRSATRMSGLSVDKKEKEKEKEKIEKKKEVSEKAPSGVVAGAFGGGGGGEGGKYPVTRATYDDRRRVFGENRIPSKKTKTLLELMWMAFTDKVLILLSVAAVVSLALGLYQDLGTPPDRYFGPGCDPEVGCKHEKEQRRENTTSPSAFTTSSSAPSSTSRLSRVPLIGRFFTPKDEDGIPLPATSGKGGSSSSSDENAEGDGDGKKKKKKEKEVPDKAELIADPSDEGMAPFSPSVKPSLLNALVDPKSFENLEALGRTDGLLASLGVVDGQGLDVAFEATLQRSATRMSGLSVDKKEKEKEKEKIEKKKEVSEKAPSGAVAGAFGGGGGGEGGKYPVTRATYDDRRRVFGENRIPSKKTKTLLELMWMAFTDKVLILLSVAAVVSLALGLYQDLGTPPDRYFGPGCDPEVGCKQPQVDWVEGLAIMIAILIVVVVGSVNDYQKERQFQKLNSIKEARFVKVIRQGGQEQQISVYDVVVGDILLLEPGEIIPVDGVFLSGHNVKCDESGATGEPDLIKKCTYEEAMKKQEAGKLGAHEDCFLLSGSKVAEGYGRYLCIAVGTRSFNGRIMMSLQRPAETTPLQNKLNHLAQTIAKLGSAAGGLLFFVLMIRFFIQLGTHSDRSADDKAQNFIQILIIAVTVIVVAVPEGLPLAVTLSLAFATRRMTKMNLLVRVLGSCETMGHCTVTCTDKTGTLTQNKMMVVAGSVGVHLKFADNLEETRRTNANDDVDIDPENPPSRASSSYDEAITPVTPRVGRKDFSIDLKDLDSRLSPALKSLINESIAINSTAFEGEDERTGEMTFIGSKTEVALLTMARNLGWPKYKEVREKAEIVQMIPFSSERKCMGVVVKLPDGKHRLYLKGASEVLAKLCLRHVHVDELPDVSTTNISDIRLIALNDETRGNINRTIIYYANQSLRTIALCYRDLPQWPIGSAKAREANGGEVPFSELVRDLTLIGITAIEDPLRPGVTEAVAIFNIVAVVVTFVSAVASSDEQSVLTAVQLLWVNLIMDTFAALALATDPATPVVLKRKPDKASDPLISVDMWKMIVGQATYQTICALVLHFAGKAIFGYTATGHEGDIPV